MEKFGIYILTYPKDYYLTKVLINSIRYFHPELPIMIVPGTGFDVNNHPFTDILILQNENPDWNDFEYYDRKFWIFNGPFDKFLYIDSDMICVKPFHVLIKSIMSQNKPFMYVNVKANLLQKNTSNKLRSIIIKSLNDAAQLGNISKLTQFDPLFDFESVYPFNTGLFATSKTSFNVDIFNDFRRRMYAFFNSNLHCNYYGRCTKLFFVDQGQIIYLSNRMGIDLISLYPDGNFIWGGDNIDLRSQDIETVRHDFTFIHWAGCPRPSKSLFNRGLLLKYKLKLYADTGLRYSFKDQNEIPGLSAWEHFCQDKSILQTLKFTCGDILGINKMLFRRICG